MLQDTGLDKAWAALTAFRAAPQQLQSLALGNIPLDPDVTSALTAAAPQLSKFRHTCTDLETNTGGLPAVLAQLAPRLEHLTLGSTAGFAPALAAPLRDCTRLTSLHLSRCPISPSTNMFHMLEPLAGLTALRELQVEGCAAGSAAPALAPLTRLTRLDWRVLIRDSSAAALLPVITQLPNLAELRLVVEGLRAADLNMLSGLTCLTCLELARIEDQDRTEEGVQVAAPMALRLPPCLRDLNVYFGASPAAVVALHTPPSLKSFRLLGLFPVRVDAEGRLEAAEAEALLAACARLAGKYDATQRLLVRLPDGAKPPAVWAEGGWAPLMAALGQLRLRWLALEGDMSLSTQDVVALTRHLGRLEVLKLGCTVPLTAMHWLSRLDRLRRVGLLPMRAFNVHDYEDMWGSCRAVCLAVLPLCVSSPSLREVVLEVGGSDGSARQSLCNAADSIQRELKAMGKDFVKIVCHREDNVASML